MIRIYFLLSTTVGNEDNAEIVDASGSSMVLNAASYVLSSQMSEKVIIILIVHHA